MNLITKIVIPAAGLGTRFYPTTKIIPKELLPVLNVPAIQHIANEAIRSGIQDLIIINSRNKPLLSEWIFQFNREHNTNGISASELIQESPLGLGHAILQSQTLVGDEVFGVMLPDDIIFSYPPALKQMIDLYQESRSSVLCVKKTPTNLLSNYGVIKSDGDRITGIVEKPEPHKAPSNFCALGRYILEPEIFNYLQTAKPTVNKEIQLTDSLNLMMEHQDFYKHIVQGNHFDIGTPPGLLSASIFASQNPNLVSGQY